MSTIIEALKKTRERQGNNVQPVMQEPAVSKQAAPGAEHSHHPQSLGLMQFNAALCVVLVGLIGTGLWVNFKVASGMAVAKNDMAVITNQIKGQSQKLALLNDTIVRLEKTNEYQKQEIQGRLAKFNDAVHREVGQQKQALLKTIEKQDETISKLSMSQEQVKTMIKSYKEMNQELNSRVDVLLEKINLLGVHS